MEKEVYHHLLKEHYHLADAELKRLSTGCNATYLVTCQEKRHIMRVYLHEQRTLNDIRQEIKLLLWLQKSNAPVQAPVATVAGGYLVQLPAHAGRYMLLLEYAEGESPRDLNEEQCVQAGRALATIHQHSDELEITLHKHDLLPELISEFAYEEVKNALNDHPYIELLKLISDKLTEGINSFGIPREKPYFGLCHADYYAMNVIWHKDDSCTVIDFDLMAHGYRAYDAAMFKWLFTILKRIAPADKERLWQALLKGYQQVRKLSEKELAAIDHFVALYQVYLLGARVQAAIFRGPFPEGYWEDNFAYLVTWVNTRCNININAPGYPNL